MSTLPRGRRELHRVVQQVPENLLHAAAVRVISGTWRPQLGDQPNTLCVRRRLERLHRGIDNGRHIHASQLETQRSRGQLVHLQQVFDQFRLHLGISLNRRDGLLQDL